MTGASSGLRFHPLTARSVATLAPQRPLRDCIALVCLRDGDCLTELEDLLRELACARVDRGRSDGPSSVVLDMPSRRCELWLELRRTGPTEVLSTADFPVLRYLLERWYLDYAVWEALLPREAAGSLPGRRLIIDGYERRGRSIAWRARELGLRVSVRDPEPTRLLEAVFDGFATCHSSTADEGSLYLDSSDAASRGVFAVPGHVPRGLADELLALTALVLSKFPENDADLKTGAGRCRMADECSKALTNLILQLRGEGR